LLNQKKGSRPIRNKAMLAMLFFRPVKQKTAVAYRYVNFRPYWTAGSPSTLHSVHIDGNDYYTA